jgi:hypothetical protein
MAYLSRSGSYELNCNRTLLPSPWQKDNLSHIANHINGSKRRKLDTIDRNINNGQNAPPTNQVTTYNRFEILESIHDSMEETETLPNQYIQKVPPLSRIFIDDVVDIQTMIKSIEKDINKVDYQLKILIFSCF